MKKKVQEKVKKKVSDHVRWRNKFLSRVNKLMAVVYNIIAQKKLNWEEFHAGSWDGKVEINHDDIECELLWRNDMQWLTELSYQEIEVLINACFRVYDSYDTIEARVFIKKDRGIQD